MYCKKYGGTTVECLLSVIPWAWLQQPWRTWSHTPGYSPSPLTALKKNQVPLSPGTGPSREQNPQWRKVAGRTCDHSHFTMQIGNANSPSQHRNQPFLKTKAKHTKNRTTIWPCHSTFLSLSPALPQGALTVPVAPWFSFCFLSSSPSDFRLSGPLPGNVLEALAVFIPLPNLYSHSMMNHTLLFMASSFRMVTALSRQHLPSRDTQWDEC